MQDRINLGALHARDGLFYTREAAAILYEVCSRLNNAEEEGHPLAPPTLDRLWVTADGELIIDEAPADATGNPMPALASLVEAVLPPTLRGQPDFAVPSSLRLLAPRARHWPPGLPPIEAPGDLAAAVNRYRGGSSSASILRALFARTAQQPSAPPAPVPAAPSAAVITPAPLPDLARDAEEDSRSAGCPPDAPTRVSREVRPVTDNRASGQIELLRSDQSGRHEPTGHLPSHWGPRGSRASRTMRYARAAVLSAAAMLFVCGASYEVTRRFVAWHEWNARAHEGHPSTSVRREPREAPHPPRTLAGPPLTKTESPAGVSHTGVMTVPAAPLDIPSSTGPVFSPSFAASGSSLVFHAGRDPVARLMMTDLRTGAAPLPIATIINDDSRNYHPRLSPDGRSVAFDSDRDGVRGVYLANRDGSYLRRISGPGFAAVPAWAPDMRSLTFVRGEPTRPRVWNLWLHDLSTGTESRLTAYRYGQTWGASWFPDARRVCYSHEDQLVILDVPSGQTRVFRSPQAGRLVRTPAVSPDGQRIAFQVTHSGVWLLDVRSGAMHRILADATAEEFAWDPEGRHLAYHSRLSGTWRIWLATVPDVTSVGP